jgi:genetic interactor of prohibitins 3, mitochondrial
LGLGRSESETRREEELQEEDDVFRRTVQSVDAAELEKLGVSKEVAQSLAPEPIASRLGKPVKTPICDRCHLLLHHQTGASIFHPTIDSIKDTLAESPYKYNHVYHILDAADFPMSLLPKIHSILDLMPLRSKNRRSQAGKFYHGRKTEMSFIITRSDLLAPTKDQVDNLLPYLREVLRDALGRSGSNLRLGNIRCVSAKRSWWTKELREDIWKRGGAGWMVGKVNVGKSQLFEAVFPKGRMDWDPSRHQIQVDMYTKEGQEGQEATIEESKENPSEEIDAQTAEKPTEEDPDKDLIEKVEADDVDEFSLLPPAPPETQYPEMPLVSDLPGTTASPIRVPFGNGRGELIDLPGLERTGLEKYVAPEHRPSLVLRARVVPTQLVLKPGQSLVLGGGLIRLTPRGMPAPVVLSYAFTPLAAHLTSTDKAVALQAQEPGAVNIERVAAPGAAEATRHAGAFPLRWDVTRERAGPITRRDAVGMRVDRLPYRVLAADLLVEGVGWVEVAAQVRTRDLYAPRSSNGDSRALAASEPPAPTEQAEEAQDDDVEEGLSALERLEAVAEAEGGGGAGRRTPAPKPKPTTEGPEPNWPIIDVYSPEGKFIGIRRPMNGWLLNKPRDKATASRPRKSMKGVKKAEKKRRREAAAASASGN